MANNSLTFSSPAGSTPLVGGRNQIATFPVGNLSSIRVYAFVRPNTPQVTLYLINPRTPRSRRHRHGGGCPRQNRAQRP